MDVSADPRRNRLLAALPDALALRWLPHLHSVRLPVGERRLPRNPVTGAPAAIRSASAGSSFGSRSTVVGLGGRIR